MASINPEPRDKPRAIPILKFKENSIELDKDAVKSIFRDPLIQDKPLCIVSMSGAFRKGKSFMLNFFIRYLRNRKYGGNPNWIGEQNVDVSLNEGFEWKGGLKACTEGILVWSEVFTAKKDGKEVAILLMDTQGLFDNNTDSKTNSIIFALSALISSVQILNLTQQIQEGDLGFLQFCTAYAQAARKEDSSSPNLKPFQTLLFLVRDWPHPNDFNYGMDGGEKYLAKVLSSESTSEELSSVRRFLTSSFESKKCCLMPHPGLNVATSSNAFTGCLKDIGKDFVSDTVKFVESLFQPTDLVVKTVNGQAVNASGMQQYIVDCGASMADGKLPNPRTMTENVAEAQNFEAQKQCLEEYRQNLKKTLGNSFVDEAFLCDMHDQALAGALLKFTDMTRFGSEESRKKHRGFLQSAIERDYGMLAQVNRGKKLEAENRLMKVIENITAEYEKRLKEVGTMPEVVHVFVGEYQQKFEAFTKERQFLSHLEIEDVHERFEKEAFKKYNETDCVHQELVHQYFQRLQSMIGRIYKGIKSENDEKRRIATEPNEIEKELLKLELKGVIQYRARMLQLVEHHTDQTELDNLNNQEKGAVVGQFQTEASDIGASYDAETRNNHLVSLNFRLDKEFQRICQINEEKKTIFEKYLELRANNLVVEYQRKFFWLLNDNYMKEDALKRKHDNVVKDLMEEETFSLLEANVRRVTIVDQHLEDVEKWLNSKYSDIEKWNDENKTFFIKCSEFIKSAVATIVEKVKDLF